MSPPLKPQVCVMEGKLAVFMAADYKLLDRPAAKTFMRDIQRGYAQLLREEKRKKRAAR